MGFWMVKSQNWLKLDHLCIGKYLLQNLNIYVYTLQLPFTCCCYCRSKKKVRYLPLFCSLNWIFLIWHRNRIPFEILSLEYKNKNNGQIVTNTWYCVIMFSLALWYWIMRLQCMSMCVYAYMRACVVSRMPYWHTFVRKKICKNEIFVPVKIEILSICENIKMLN